MCFLLIYKPWNSRYNTYVLLDVGMTRIYEKKLPVIPISSYFSIIMERSHRATDGRSRLDRQSKSRIIRIFDQKPVTIFSTVFSQRYTNPGPIILCSGRIIFSIWLRNNGRLSGGRPAARNEHVS